MTSGSPGFGETGDRAGALINERQWFGIAYPFELRRSITARLLFHRGDLLAPFFGLCLDDANCLPIDEQRIVGRANSDASEVFESAEHDLHAPVALVTTLVVLDGSLAVALAGYNGDRALFPQHGTQAVTPDSTQRCG